MLKIAINNGDRSELEEAVERMLEQAKESEDMTYDGPTRIFANAIVEQLLEALDIRVTSHV